MKCLLIHGRQDDVVPFEDSEKLAATSDGAELWEVQATHKLDFIVEDGTLERAVRALLDGTGASA